MMPTIPNEQIVEMELTLRDLLDQLADANQKFLELEDANSGLLEALNRVRKERDG